MGTTHFFLAKYLMFTLRCIFFREFHTMIEIDKCRWDSIFYLVFDLSPNIKLMLVPHLSICVASTHRFSTNQLSSTHITHSYFTSIDISIISISVCLFFSSIWNKLHVLDRLLVKMLFEVYLALDLFYLFYSFVLRCFLFWGGFDTRKIFKTYLCKFIEWRIYRSSHAI